MFQVVQRNWLSSVISFDNTTREYIAQHLWRPLFRFLNDLFKTIQNVFANFKSNSPGTLVVQLFFGLCLLGAMAAAILLIRSVLTPALGGSSTLAARKLRSFVAILEHQYRKRRQPHQTAREFAHSLALAPTAASAADTALTLLESACYGSSEWTSVQEVALKQHIATLCRSPNAAHH